MYAGATTAKTSIAQNRRGFSSYEFLPTIVSHALKGREQMSSLLDFGKLRGGSTGSGSDIIEPRKIFTTLPRNPRFRRPSDDQGEVLDKWFAARTRPDNTLKMNTGSGKTLVGLLALQSSLNEGVSPAVYVTPDNYLATQVLEEAKDLGISATDNERDPEFIAGRSILVANIYKLINGRSVFGTGATGVRIPIGTLVVDDAHACLSTVKDQFTLLLDSDHDVYKSLFKLFRSDLETQSPTGVLDVESHDPQIVMLVPHWAWLDKQDRVIRLLHEFRDDDALKFVWPLIRDVIGLCRCAFGAGRVEVAPRCLPIDQIPSFINAKRRIYMTATLADDGILITHFNADPNAVADPIKPKGAGDLGDRMILAPQEINPNITQDDVKALAAEISKQYNVAVIVPSLRRANFWKDVAAQILDRKNIGDGIASLKKGLVRGITVLVNKYDGVDLPDDACRLLIIDGLPETFGLLERVDFQILEGTQQQVLQQVQTLEQGMGRGVRSAEDYCAVLLLGPRLTQRVHLPEARTKFTPATLAQLELGRDVTAQVRGKPVSELRPLIDYCLTKDPTWWRTGRERLAAAPEGAPSFIDPAVREIRIAFDAARTQRFDLACEAIQRAVNNATEKPVRGFLKQQLAEYTYPIDRARSQEILLSALQDNPRVTRPLAGITYTRLTPAAANQATAAEQFMRSRFVDKNALVLFANALLDDLVWDEFRTKQFEAAIRDLGLFLGFGSQRPEAETGRGPDNLWAIGSLKFLVIECKSGATSPLISKQDCNQLLGSLSWFGDSYDNTCSATPIIIHPVAEFDKYSSPAAETRVIDRAMLDTLKRAVKTYATSLSASGLPTRGAIDTQLNALGLTEKKFVSTFTKSFSVAR
jgi:hypothetical protein